MQVHIQGRLCTVETAQWRDLLQTAFPDNGPRAAYIYVSHQGELSTSPTLVYQPDRMKLRVSDIIATSRNVFYSYQNCSDIDNRAIREIYSKMIPRAKNSWCSMILHWLLGFGFSTTLELLARELAVLEQSRNNNSSIGRISQQKATFEPLLEQFRIYAEHSADDRFRSRYLQFAEAYRNWTIHFASDQNALADYERLEMELSRQYQTLSESVNLYSSLLAIAQQKNELSDNLLKIVEESESDLIDEMMRKFMGIENELADFVDELFANKTFNDDAIAPTLRELESRLSSLEKVLNPSPKSLISTPQRAAPYRFSHSPFKKDLNSPLHNRVRTPAKTANSSGYASRALDFNFS